MNYEIVELEKRIIVGLKDRTANNDAGMMEKIGKLWHDYYDKIEKGDSVYDKIKNKNSEYAYGLYCDYEDDTIEQNKLNYSVFVGASVAKNENSELEEKIIPSGRYAKFVAKGKMQEAVGECWQKIWQTPLNRAFTVDFEEYVTSDMENCTINIYVAIK